MTGDPAAPDLSRRALATLSYLGGWATGLVVWLIERDDTVVRFHAAQAVLLFGGLTVLWLAVWVGSFLVLTFSAGGFTALQWVARGVLIGMAVAWVVVLWRSWRTQNWRLPIVAGPAERAARWRSRA